MTAEDPGPPAAGRRGSGDPVLVLNSGSSSVKFALLRPATGERLLGGIGERLGTPDAVLRTRQFPGRAAEDKLPGGTHREVLARVLDQVREAGPRGGRLLGAGHRVVHGGEQFTASVRVDDEVIAAIRSFSHLAPLHNPADLAGIEAAHGRRTGGRVSVAGRVLALVVPTDEELLIARDTARIIAGG
jgi:acetate kinase